MLQEACSHFNNKRCPLDPDVAAGFCGLHNVRHEQNGGAPVSNKKIELVKEIVQAGSDVAELATDAGVPGIGLMVIFVQGFYERHLQKRFAKFLSDAKVDQAMIDKILSDENYASMLL